MWYVMLKWISIKIGKAFIGDGNYKIGIFYVRKENWNKSLRHGAPKASTQTSTKRCYVAYLEPHNSVLDFSLSIIISIFFYNTLSFNYSFLFIWGHSIFIDTVLFIFLFMYIQHQQKSKQNKTNKIELFLGPIQYILLVIFPFQRFDYSVFFVESWK